MTVSIPQVKSVLFQAVSLPPEEQLLFVAQACEGDEALRAEVERLLECRRALTAGTHPVTPAASEPDDPDSPSFEHLILQRYEAGPVIGVGGFGEVRRGTDTITKQEVAIKLISVTSPRKERMYDREVATLLQARVPGVVELLDTGREGAWAFLVMRYVDGAAFPGADVEVGNVDAILPRAVSLLQAVTHLHAAGIYHRDLKPSNVIVDQAGRATLVDLGIAEDDTDASRWLPARELLGTERYLAPERRRGRRATAQSDLFSVGVMLDELLLAADPRLREFIDRMQAADPRERPGSALEALTELRAIAGMDRARLELATVGDVPAVDAIVDAVLAGRSVDVCGRAGAGKTYVLAEAARRLERRGRAVSWYCDSIDDDTPAGLDTTLFRALSELSPDHVLFVDDCEALGRAAQDAIARHDCTVRVVERAAAVEVEYLEADALRELFDSPDRLFHAREDAARILWERTRGCPAEIVRELEAWCDAGLARCDGRIRLRPHDVKRLRSMGRFAVPRLEDDAGLDARTLDVWHAASVARARIPLPALCAPTGSSDEEVRACVRRLHRAGVVDWDESGGVLALRDSPSLAARTIAERMVIARAVADHVPRRSEAHVRHLVEIEQYEHAGEIASDTARLRLREGRIDEAIQLCEFGLSLARRHLAAERALYASLIATLVEAAVFKATSASIDLARYHIRLAPQQSESMRHWGRLMEATAMALNGNPKPCLAMLDATNGELSEAQRRMRHIIANTVARWANDSEMRLEHLRAAARWAQSEPTADARRLLAAWTGWLRYDEGKFEAAHRLHERAARLAQHPRARITAQCNAATAAIECGRLDAAEELARAAGAGAAKSRDVVNEIRATYLQRSARYRRGESCRPDDELMNAVRWSDMTTQRALMELTEAAIAWREGENRKARDWATQSKETFRACGNRLPALLAGALAAAANGRPDNALLTDLYGTPPTTKPVGVLSQAVALAAMVDELQAIPKSLKDRANEWTRSAKNNRRREVLKPDEVSAALAGLR